jgi:hypothetical protein
LAQIQANLSPGISRHMDVLRAHRPPAETRRAALRIV